MSLSSHAADKGPFQRTVEIGVAIACAIFGLITIFGSLKVGIGWGAGGPKSGFFPFYVGVVIVLSSFMNLRTAWHGERKTLFASWGQLGQVLAVVAPTTVYVFILPYIGIYLASFLLIAGFMVTLGKYNWVTSLALGVAVPAAIYVLFEKWFLVPLPKGPIESWFGL